MISIKTGIYGGTFSPPHNGHIAAARAFIESMGLDELLVIPTSIPPHKQLLYADDPNKRFEMCRISFGKIEKTTVSDIELARGGKSYTSDTLKELSAEGRELYLLCGTDMIMTLDEWHSPEEIFRLSTPVCIRRENSIYGEKLLLRKIASYKKKYGKEIVIIDAPAVEISSSELRDCVRTGRKITGLVPASVEQYIIDCGMYK